VNAVLAYVDAGDHRVARRFAAWRPPRWFRLWMLAATRLGDGWLWLAAGCLLLAAGREQRIAQQAAGLALFVTNAVVVTLKRCCRRRRPEAFLPGRAGLYAFDQFSFPSGHTMNAFAASTLLALAFPFLTPLAALVAASIGLSRLVLRAHFPSDVLAGAVLGTIIGAGSFGLAVAGADRLESLKWDDASSPGTCGGKPPALRATLDTDADGAVSIPAWPPAAAVVLRLREVGRMSPAEWEAFRRSRLGE
jgi:undecaprenyl-diphosphatase